MASWHPGDRQMDFPCIVSQFADLAQSTTGFLAGLPPRARPKSPSDMFFQSPSESFGWRLVIWGVPHPLVAAAKFKRSGSAGVWPIPNASENGCPARLLPASAAVRQRRWGATRRYSTPHCHQKICPHPRWGIAWERHEESRIKWRDQRDRGNRLLWSTARQRAHATWRRHWQEKPPGLDPKPVETNPGIAPIQESTLTPSQCSFVFAIFQNCPAGKTGCGRPGSRWFPKLSKGYQK